MIKSVFFTTILLERGESLNKDKKYCSRGLESHTRSGAMSKTHNHKLASDAILDEHQEEQRRLVGAVGREAIAEQYTRAASSWYLWARTVRLHFVISEQANAEEYVMDDDDSYQSPLYFSQI
jgi:hypothetical protein